MYAEWKGFTRSVTRRRRGEQNERSLEAERMFAISKTNSSMNVHTRNSWMKLARLLLRSFFFLFFFFFPLSFLPLREREIYPFLECENNWSDDASVIVFLSFWKIEQLAERNAKSDTMQFEFESINFFQYSLSASLERSKLCGEKIVSRF